MRRLFVCLLLLLAAGAARADEATDRLAKELVGVVRDPRQGVIQRVEAARTLAKLGPQAAVVVPDLIAQVQRLKGDELEPLQEAVIETRKNVPERISAALESVLSERQSN